MSQLSAAAPRIESVDHLFRRAVSAHLSQDTAQAARLYRQVLRSEPSHAESLNNLGTLLAQGGDPKAAIELFERAVASQPMYGEALNNLGLVHRELGDSERAQDWFRRAIELNSDVADWQNNFGNCCVELYRFDDALAAFDRAIALRPGVPDYWSNRGLALRGLRRPEEAIESLARAIGIEPGHVNALSNLGVVLKEQRQFARAIETFERALAVQPDNPALIGNFASVFELMGDHDRMRELARQAAAIDPEYPESYNLLANAELEAGEYERAEALYQRALALDPQNRNANWNLALIWLTRGDYQRGWKQFEWRKRLQSVLIDYGHYDGPEWDGAPLGGRRILLHTEQGIGDAIQFIRYARELRAVGAGQVIVECPVPLVGLLSRVDGVDLAVARGAALPPYDTHANLMSLPGLFGTTLDTIPARVPYLPIEPSAVASIVTAPPGQLKVGIVWAGNPVHQRDRLRSVALERFAPLFEIPGVTWFSLQKSPTAADELRSIGRHEIIDLSPYLGDFRDTAAAVARLDLVIAVDTSVAHLAGALGRPAWVLLPGVSDFRWLRGRTDSPWYPTARLFRQPAAGDWDAVIREVGEALRVTAAASTNAEAAVADESPCAPVPVATVSSVMHDSAGRPRFDLWIPLASLSDERWFSAYAAELVGEGHLRALRAFWDEAAEAVDAIVDLAPAIGLATFSFASGPSAPPCVIAVEPDESNRVRLTSLASARPYAAPVIVVGDVDHAVAVLREAGAVRVGVHAEHAHLCAEMLDRLGAGKQPMPVVALTYTPPPRQLAGPLFDRLTALELLPFAVTHENGTPGLDAVDEDGGSEPLAWLSLDALDRLSDECQGTIRPTETAADMAPLPVAVSLGAAASASATRPARTSIGIDWEIRTDTGWGVYGLNLALELLKRGDVQPALFDAGASPLPPLAAHLLADARRSAAARSGGSSLDGVMLRALGNNFGAGKDFDRWRARGNAGVIFFEDSAFDAAAMRRARSLDTIIAGSSWNANVLRERGLERVVAVPQGIDPTTFHPAPRSGRFGDRFVVFSGGKLEFRKGQDILIAAFREFRRRHPEALLVTAWHNAWPQLIADLELAGHVQGTPVASDGRLHVAEWLEANGLPPGTVLDVGRMPNESMGAVLREADVALFTNRCEGGTNLVAMECMASGVPVILSANTGHLDLVGTGSTAPLRSQGKVPQPTRFFRDTAGWGESSVEEVLEALESVWSRRESARTMADRAASVMRDWTWERQTGRLVAAIAPLLAL